MYVKLFGPPFLFCCHIQCDRLEMLMVFNVLNNTKMLISCIPVIFILAVR